MEAVNIMADMMNYDKILVLLPNSLKSMAFVLNTQSLVRHSRMVLLKGVIAH